MHSSIQNLDHLKIPLEDVLEATNHFSDENFIRQGGFGKIYKGKLLRSGELIDIVARRLDTFYGQGSKQFWTEISMLSSLKHDNLVSLVGFCNENKEKIVINKYEPKGSLDNYLSDPTVTWLQRLQICVGVAYALSYIYYDEGRKFSVIHRNIKSSKILLNDNWEPRVSGFELSITNNSNRKHSVLYSDPCGTIGYVDPIYVKTGGVTHKSDMYSFGVVLSEVLFGKKAIINKRDIKLAELAISHYEERKLDDFIDPDLRKQMNQESFDNFSDTMYHCLKVDRPKRRNIDEIIIRLEKALDLQRKQENPILKTLPAVAAPLEGTPKYNLKDLEHLRIKFSDIQSATDNFSNKYRIRSVYRIHTRPGYRKRSKILEFVMYKAQLKIFDSKSFSEIEGKNKCELPKKISTVAIKRYCEEEKKNEPMFLTEILALNKYKHPNIVSVLGYCDEGLEKIIVYDDDTHGCLADHLGSTRNIANFTWVQRIKICIDVAHGLDYIHKRRENNGTKLHHFISSSNILLKENWEAMIGGFSEDDQSDFYSSRFKNRKYNFLMEYRADTYEPTDRYGGDRKEKDIYCFGIVLFEILCWRFAHDPIYQRKKDMGLASFVRRCFKEGTPNEILDLKLREESEENIFSKGINKNSLDTFTNIAYQCLGNTQSQRPTIQLVIKELEKALHFQENRNKDNLKISLEDIRLATQDFSSHNLIGKGGFGQVYKGEVTHKHGRELIAAKRLDRESDQGETEHMTELEILLEYKHENVISLVGYCNEKGEKISVYEYASGGSLDRWLKYDGLTWRERLKICVDIARGLAFLHGTSYKKQEVVIHRDIKSANVLLDGDWKAKISDFGLSLISPINQEMNYVIDNAKGTPGYCDPLYITTGFLTKESDIYSFGVLLFEMLCGRFVIEFDYNGKARNLVHLVRRHYKDGTLNEIVFEATKKQMVPESLTTFQNIAYQCIHEERAKRPTANDVLIQLEKALECQEDIEIWEPKLPRDHKKIIQMTDSPKMYSAMSNKDIYTMLHKGILLSEERVWFSLGTNEERVEIISPKEFRFESYYGPDKWKSIQKSRFRNVAQVSDSSNLKIRISIKVQFLSPGVHYGVYLLFKFCGPRKSSTQTYVNLTFKMGTQYLHSDFATRRDDGWMMNELYQFPNLQEEADFDVFLEGFSESSFKNQAIYVEGVEFRAISNMTPEEIIEESKKFNILKAQQSTTDEGDSKVNSTDVQVPTEEGGLISRFVLWVLEKCCG